MRAPFTDSQRDQIRQHAEGLVYLARFHPGDWPMISANLPRGRWLMLAVRETIHGQPAERMYLFSEAEPRLAVSELLPAEDVLARLDELLTRATLAKTSPR